MTIGIGDANTFSPTLNEYLMSRAIRQLQQEKDEAETEVKNAMGVARHWIDRAETAEAEVAALREKAENR